MTRGSISKRVVADRVKWVETMLGQIRDLPVQDKHMFFSDPRNPLACESCLRRALEALLDLGRHILAKDFGIGVEEYKEIGPVLARQGVMTEEDARLFRILAGYRNRMVHFYHEVSNEEILDICSNQLSDLEIVLEAIRGWLKKRLNVNDDQSSEPKDNGK